MKKILLIGDYKDNGGPTNVNRGLITNSAGRISCIKSNNKYLKILESILKLLFNNVIVISGYSAESIFYTDIAHFFGKKVVYIMHGCVKYENEINKLSLSEKYIQSELVFLKKVDLILCVSKLYSYWVKEYYNQVVDNISYLNNGIPEINIDDIEKNKKNKKSNKVVLMGGNRNIKNNLVVCNALDELISEGVRIEVYLYGRNYPNNEIINSKNVIYKGMVSPKELMEELKEDSIYICNSYVESFGLSVIDALIAGCDIIINKNIGAASTFKIDEKYVIKDCNNIKEIKEKIINVMANPNNSEIVNTIKTDTNYKYSANRLIEICDSI